MFPSDVFRIAKLFLKQSCPLEAAALSGSPSALQALSRMGHIWRKGQTVWVNVGGLHAAVYLLRRTWERAEERRSFW